jgi:hypothetical protein
MIHSSKNIRYITITLLIIGIILVTSGLYYLNKVSSSNTWTEVNGRIIDAQMNEFPATTVNKSCIFYPDIKYEYHFNQKTYFSHQIGCNFKWTPALTGGYYGGSEEQVSQFLKRFKFNSIVKVYVNPENPSQSALINGVRLHDFIYLILGMLSISAALYLKIFNRAFFYDQS